VDSGSENAPTHESSAARTLVAAPARNITDTDHAAKGKFSWKFN